MEDTLSLKDVLGVLRRRFWIVSVIVFIAVVLAALPSYVIDRVSPRPLLNIAVAFVAALMVGLRVLAIVPDMNAKRARHGRAY